MLQLDVYTKYSPYKVCTVQRLSGLPTVKPQHTLPYCAVPYVATEQPETTILFIKAPQLYCLYYSLTGRLQYFHLLVLQQVTNYQAILF